MPIGTLVKVAYPILNEYQYGIITKNPYRSHNRTFVWLEQSRKAFVKNNVISNISEIEKLLYF